MVVVISLALVDELQPDTWNIVFWLIMLFVAINAVAKSFMGESDEVQMYLYGLVGPGAIILAKLIYNIGLLFIVGLISFVSFAFLGDVQVANVGRFIGIILLGALSMSANLTLVSAIAARAENKSTLLAVLSFPLLVPVMLLLIELTQEAMIKSSGNYDYESVSFLVGITMAMIVASVLLFPFIWKE